MDQIEMLIEKMNERLIKNGYDIFDPEIKEMIHNTFHEMTKENGTT
jgi:hypothetical protein